MCKGVDEETLLGFFSQVSRLFYSILVVSLSTWMTANVVGAMIYFAKDVRWTLL